MPTPFGNSGGGLMGSPDVTQSLGGEDASCHHAGLSAVAAQNCQASGFAQSAYPPSNYGTDTHVNTGITDPGNDVASIVQEVLGWIFEVMAHILTWIILGMGLAFNFDLFGQGHSQISTSLAGAERAFTLPLLPIALTIGAIAGIGYLASNRHGRAVKHWLLMLALMLVGLVIIQNPVGTLGGLNTAANGISQAALGAFDGSPGSTTNSFANATPGIWQTAMEKPWCAVEFGSVDWCMAPIDKTMRAARQSVLQHLPQALGDQGTPQLAAQQAPLERKRLAAAQTNGELFLSFLPNSDARNGKNDTWTLYHALLQDQPQMAALRDAGGVSERIVSMLIAAAAGIFFLVLMIYIAWQLIANRIFFVVCLLLAPVAVLTPAFGERGRAVFVRWSVWLAEALVKTILFAIYLGVVLLASSVIFTVAFGIGWGLGWILLGALWAGALLYRRKLMDLMTAGLYHEHSHPVHTPGILVAAMAGRMLSRHRVGTYPTRPPLAERLLGQGQPQPVAAAAAGPTYTAGPTYNFYQTQQNARFWSAQPPRYVAPEPPPQLPPGGQAQLPPPE